MNWYGQHILILGLGDSGLAAARWLARRGADLRVADTSAAPANLPRLQQALPEVAVTTGEFVEADFLWADRIIISPYAAKRLVTLFDGVVREYEKRFGALNVEGPVPTK